MGTASGGREVLDMCANDYAFCARSSTGRVVSWGHLARLRTGFVPGRFGFHLCPSPVESLSGVVQGVALRNPKQPEAGSGFSPMSTFMRATHFGYSLVTHTCLLEVRDVWPSMDNICTEGPSAFLLEGGGIRASSCLKWVCLKESQGLSK